MADFPSVRFFAQRALVTKDAGITVPVRCTCREARSGQTSGPAAVSLSSGREYSCSGSLDLV